MEQQHDTSNINSILKELSDIKASLAVNTNETKNIKDNIAEIKTDMKEIKNDFVNRRELNEAIVAIYEQISPLKKIAYGLVGVVGIAVIGAVLKLILK